MKVTDADLEEKINEFGELSNEIDVIKASLSKLQKRYKQLDEHLTPILEELVRTQDTAMETDKYLVSIKTAGYERETPKYKEAFMLALSKVNRATQSILNEALAANTSTSRIATQIGVQKAPMTEIDITGMFRKFKSFVSMAYRKLTNLNNDLSAGMDNIKKLSNLIK